MRCSNKCCNAVYTRTGEICPSDISSVRFLVTETNSGDMHVLEYGAVAGYRKAGIVEAGAK